MTLAFPTESNRRPGQPGSRCHRTPAPGAAKSVAEASAEVPARVARARDEGRAEHMPRGVGTPKARISTFRKESWELLKQRATYHDVVEAIRIPQVTRPRRIFIEK